MQTIAFISFDTESFEPIAAHHAPRAAVYHVQLIALCDIALIEIRLEIEIRQAFETLHRHLYLRQLQKC